MIQSFRRLAILHWSLETSQDTTHDTGKTRNVNHLVRKSMGDKMGRQEGGEARLLGIIDCFCHHDWPRATQRRMASTSASIQDMKTNPPGAIRAARGILHAYQNWHRPSTNACSPFGLHRFQVI